MDGNVADAAPGSSGADTETPGRGPSLGLPVKPATPLSVAVPSLDVPPADVWAPKDRVAPDGMVWKNWEGDTLKQTSSEDRWKDPNYKGEFSGDRDRKGPPHPADN